MINIEEIFNKNIMIAVDESENASRAVSYVGRLLAGIGGFKILILHVIRQPDEDFFPTAAEKDQWLSQQKLKVDAMLKNYRKGSDRKGFCADGCIGSFHAPLLSFPGGMYSGGTEPIEM
jgi:hypothetical protein